MKSLFISTALLFGCFIHTMASLSPAQVVLPPTESATHKLTVSVITLTHRTDTLYVGLGNSDATFNKQSYRKTRINIPATGEVEVNFEGVPAGRYAVRVFQDLNTNQKVDFSGTIPEEPVGFSNLTVLMGPSTVERCAFEIKADKTSSIQLIGE